MIEWYNLLQKLVNMVNIYIILSRNYLKMNSLVT